MRPPPANPHELQTRAFAALCDDLFDLGAGRATGFDRTNALRAVVSARAAEKEEATDGPSQ